MLGRYASGNNTATPEMWRHPARKTKTARTRRAACNKHDEPLDQSLELYEQGERLRRHCQARLDAAQMRIRQIVTDGEGRATGAKPFDEDG